MTVHFAICSCQSLFCSMSDRYFVVCVALGEPTEPLSHVKVIHHYNYNKIIVVCLSVRPLQEVSGNDLTPRNKMLYLWPLSNRS